MDYFLRPKPSYFTIARELRPFTVGMTRKELKTPSPDHPGSSAFYSIDTILEIWGTNSTLEEKKVTLDIQVFDLFLEGAENKVYEKQEAITLSPNASTEIFKGSLVPFGQPIRTKGSEVPRTLIISTRLLDADGAVLARYANW